MDDITLRDAVSQHADMKVSDALDIWLDKYLTARGIGTTPKEALNAAIDSGEAMLLFAPGSEYTLTSEAPWTKPVGATFVQVICIGAGGGGGGGSGQRRLLCEDLSRGRVGVHMAYRGEFYVVSVPLPVDLAGKRIDTVVLEFAVDAAALSLEDTAASPAVGVFPLTRTFTGGAGEGMGAPAFESVVAPGIGSPSGAATEC